MATCGKKWSLQTQIHTSDRMIMKTFVQILKENIFTISIFGDVSNLWHKLVQENCRNIIVSERNGQHILFWINSDSCYIWSSLFCCCPFSNKLQLFLLIIDTLFFANPKTKFSCITAQYKPFRKGAYGCDNYLIIVNFIEHILILLLYFIQACSRLLYD